MTQPSSYGEFGRSKQELSEGSMARLKELADLQDQRTKTVEDLEKKLKKAEADLNEIRDRQLPELMDELGLAAFSTKDGELSITVSEELTVALPKDEVKRQHGLGWLEKNDMGGIIERDVSVNFSLEQEKQAEDLAKELEKLGFIPRIERSVHASRLKANLKECLKLGKKVPLELFGAFRFRRTKVKRRKDNGQEI